MDFFSKLGKKASETYQITKEKATNISGELKIRGKISDAKDTIEKLYKEIGEIVFAEIKAGTDVAKEDIVGKCDEISKLKEEIEKAELEILALKKLKKCEKCGTELDEQAEFCSKCGTKQPIVEKEEVQVKTEETVEAPQIKEAEVVEIKDVEEEEPKEEKMEEEVEDKEENKE